MVQRLIAIMISIIVFVGVVAFAPTNGVRAAGEETFGKEIASQLFQMDQNRNQRLDMTDRKMLLELVQFFSEAEDRNKMKELYTHAFGDMVTGRQDQTLSFGASIQLLEGFINFVKNNTSNFSNARFEACLTDSDTANGKAALAQAIDARENEFKTAMHDAGVDLDQLGSAVDNLDKMFAFLRKSKVFHTEFFTCDYRLSQNDRIKMNEDRINEMVQQINENLTSKIEDPTSITQAMNGILDFISRDQGKDREALYGYLLKYGMVVEQNKTVSQSKQLDEALTSNQVVFSDVPAGHWAYPYIQFMASNGLITESEKGLYSPETNITAAQMASFTELVKNKLMNKSSDQYFKDVVNGYTEGGSQPVKREEVAVMVVKAMGVAAPAASKKDLNFLDSALISPKAADSVAKAVKVGILNGKADNLFDPKGYTKRSEAAKMMYTLYQYLSKTN